MHVPTKLIFLPGAGGSPHFWRPVSDLLAHPASRTLLQWPWFDASQDAPQADGFADLVARVVDEIDQPCALVAQSLGGVAAIRAALERPNQVTHLVLAVTSAGVDMSEFGAEDWRPAFYAANPAAPRWLAQFKSDLSEAIKSIRVPVLLLWGDADSISPVAVGLRLKSLLPISTLHVVRGGAHEMANKLASNVAPLIDEHLSSKP